MKADWKDALSSLKTTMPDEPVTQAPSTTSNQSVTPPKQTLYLRYEKRNGKPATIISEFQGSADELKHLAKRLKQTLGIGGSAKDDEILLQGDVRSKAAELLRAEGYRLKGELGK